MDDRHFILTGLSRLTVRVSQLLSADSGNRVTVIANPGEGEGLRSLLPTSVRWASSAGEDPETVLRDQVTPETAAILALSDDDPANLRVALAADAVAPEVPLVVRAFDPVLAARLEHGANLRRAYSVSGLAAPAFVAAALADDAVHTLRLGDGEASLVRLRVEAGSTIDGLAPGEVRDRHSVEICARDRAAGEEGWRAVKTGPEREEPLLAGEEILAGGEMHAVLRLALAQGDLPRHGTRGVTLEELAIRRRGGGPPTLVPHVAAALALLLVANVIVFGVALGLGPVDALYFAVTTAFGDPGLSREDAWLKVFGVGSMIGGGALIGILFSQLASIATANRLDARMGRRAKRMTGHAIVIGLGTIGYRIERLLFDLGIPAVVIERTPDSRFAGAVGERTPVLVGDVRLLENLERAGAARAGMVFACTDDDLTNLGACLQAQRLNPAIRTVARVFDDILAERGRTAFGLDATISASSVAAAAFAGAATDAFARRAFRVGGEPWLAMRWASAGGIDASRLDGLRAEGVHVLARAGSAGKVEPLPATGTDPGDSMVIAGPEAAVNRLVSGG